MIGSPVRPLDDARLIAAKNVLGVRGLEGCARGARVRGIVLCVMRRGAAVLPVLLALAAVPAPALARRRAAHVHPRAFASCERLVGYERRHFAVTHGVPEAAPLPLFEPPIGAPLRAGSGVPRAAAPQRAGTTVAGTSFSTTNNQEPGIEEPDLVKTDGSTIFAVEQGTLYAVAASGPAPHLAGSLPLGSTGYGAQLLLRGSRLVVISGGRALPRGVGVAAPAVPAPAGGRSPALTGVTPSALALARPRPNRIPSVAPSPYYYPATTTITEVDVHDPAAMKVARTVSVDGTFVDARQNGASARLVFSSAPGASTASSPVAATGARSRRARTCAGPRSSRASACFRFSRSTSTAGCTRTTPRR